MHLTILRDHFTMTTTLSRLLVTYDGALEYTFDGWKTRNGPAVPKPCVFACEDEDRGLDTTMSAEEIRAVKVKSETAIPATAPGEVYGVVMAHSPAYEGRRDGEGRLITPDGLMPRVQRVPGYVGILLHAGNNEGHTAGCLLPGLRRDLRRGFVLDSTTAWKWLDARIRECSSRSETITLSIERDAAAWAAFQAAGGAALSVPDLSTVLGRQVALNRARVEPLLIPDGVAGERTRRNTYLFNITHGIGPTWDWTPETEAAIRQALT